MLNKIPQPISDNPAAAANRPAAGPLDIHAMPRRFAAASANGRKAKVIGLTIIVTVLTAFLVGAAFYLSYVLKKPENKVTPPINANSAGQANLNANRPLANANQNLNANRPAGANQNGNQNLNADGNLNLEIGPLPASNDLPDSLDSDADGLTDAEELIYRTDVNRSDTDGDGYLDGAEALNGYNPLGAGKLAAADLIEVFVSSLDDYSIAYPVSWTLEVVESGGQEAMFVSSTGEFVQVLVQDNPYRLTAQDWYLEQWPDLTAASLKTITVNGLAGVWDLEGLTVYLAKDDKLYVIAYSVGNKPEMNFQTTFEMMVNSFALK